MFSLQTEMKTSVSPICVLCVHGWLLIENAVDVSQLFSKVTIIKRDRVVTGKLLRHFWLTSIWKEEEKKKRGSEKNIIMTAKCKRQTFHYSGKISRLCTQVKLFKSNDNHDISEHFWRFPCETHQVSFGHDCDAPLKSRNCFVWYNCSPSLLGYTAATIRALTLEINKKKKKSILDIYMLLPCPYGSVDWLPLGKETSRAHKHRGSRNASHTFGKQH